MNIEQATPGSGAATCKLMKPYPLELATSILCSKAFENLKYLLQVEGKLEVPVLKIRICFFRFSSAWASAWAWRGAR